MESIRDNPLTLAAKQQAAQEEAQRKVPPGFNETTLGRAAQVMAPMDIEFGFIRKAAEVNETANLVTACLMDLAQGKPMRDDYLLNYIDGLLSTLPGLLLHLDMTRNMVLAAQGYAAAAKNDAGSLQGFFSVYMAEANELERRTRALEAARGQAPPPVDPDAPTYTKYEILELAARMAAEEKQRSEPNA